MAELRRGVEPGRALFGRPARQLRHVPRSGSGNIVRAVDYQVVGAPGQFRLFADDAGDVARWRRVEGAAS